MKTKKENTGCRCKKCLGSCWNNPGWFGCKREVEGAAKLFNLSIEHFAEEYLIQEWWHNGILVPAPRRNFSRMTDEQKKIFRQFPLLRSMREEEEAKNGKGFVVASWGHNLLTGYACIFLIKENRCLIHKSKPRECRELFACKGIYIKRQKLVSYWRRHQGWFDEISKKINNS